jgi:hypothetical protein
MNSSNAFLVTGAAILVFVVSCREVDAPLIRRAIEPPTQPHMTAGPPPPLGYTVSTAGGSRTELSLSNYPYDTWIEIIPDGTTFHLTAYGNAKPVTGEVGVGGASGGRNGCDFNTSVSFGQSVSSFGDCGSIVGHYDTTLARGQGFINRGSFPLDYQTVDLSDCDVALPACHVQEVKNMGFVVRPIPVVMKQVKANPHAVNFSAVTYQQVTFTTGPDPATYLIGGAVRTMPLTTTSWVYTAGDGTLDGNMCNGGYPVLYCMPYLHKSGRMVVKAFTGGWEQVSTITVQCLVSGEPAFNDSINDFSVRQGLLDLLVTSNADSSPEAGRSESNPRGWRHESGGVVWQLPNGGGYQFVPYEDPNSRQASYHLPDSQWEASAAPVPGALPYATVHDHPNNPGDNVYGVGRVLPDGSQAPYARWPGDTTADGHQREVPTKVAENPYKAGSGADWEQVFRRQIPELVVGTDSVGYIFRLNVPLQPGPRESSPFRHTGGTANEKKCAWVKKYRG